MSYSVQLYSVRNAIEEDLPGAIRRLAEIGFTQVEPYNFTSLADQLARAFAENSITAPTGHAPLLSADQDEIFAAAKRLGIGTVIDPHIPVGQWQDTASIEAAAANLNAAARKGAGYGIRIGYHNHAWELESRIDGRSALEYFASLLDPDVVLEVDTYWAAVGGEDPADLLRRLGDRVAAIHVKDGPVSKDTKAQLPAGQGKIDIASVLGAVPALEVAVVEFDDYAGDVFDGIAASLNYLKTNAPISPPH